MRHQTEDTWLLGLRSSSRGTGVFAMSKELAGEYPDHIYDSIKVETRGPLYKVFMGDIAYAATLVIGRKRGVLAFKWVPDQLADYATVVGSAKQCTPFICVNRCASYGCLCIDGECK